MKLKSVHIRNFKSIESVNFDFPESNFLILVGANNSGKSNIIRAINNLMGDTWFSGDKLEDYDFYLRNRDNEIQISLSFDTGNSVSFKKEGSEYKAMKFEGTRSSFLSNEFKGRWPCTYLGADRTYDKHMSFYDWALLGKIRKAFHQEAFSVQDELIEKFKEISAIYNKVDSFRGFKNDFTSFFDQMQADTPARLAIDFQPYTPSNFFKTLQIVAQSEDDEKIRFDLDELGEGTRNTVLLALLRSYAKNFRQEASGMLALEEPEIYMHPQARRHLFKILREIAQSGMQVVISTHSSSFVDTEFFDSIGQVHKVADNQGFLSTKVTIVAKKTLVQECVRTGVPSSKCNVANISEFYKTTSNYRLNELFFAKYVVLVEGETEELALPEYLAGQGIDCDLLGVSIVGVGGKNQIPKYLRLFQHYNAPVSILFDSDQGSNHSNKNIACCLAVDEDSLNRVEKYSVITSPNFSEVQVIALGSDFESAVRKDYEEASLANKISLDECEQQARELIKPIRDQNKAQIARFIARKLRATHATYSPEFAILIGQEIRNELKIRSGIPQADSQQTSRGEDDLPF